jgi:hypothetical protein
MTAATLIAILLEIIGSPPGIVFRPGGLPRLTASARKLSGRPQMGI